MLPGYPAGMAATSPPYPIPRGAIAWGHPARNSPAGEGWGEGGLGTTNRLVRRVKLTGATPLPTLSCRHGSNAGHSSRVPGVDAGRATSPHPRPARWGLASWCQLDPGHPALVTREDPVEPCLIPCGPSWSLSRLPAGPVLRSPLRERPGMGSTLHA